MSQAQRNVDSLVKLAERERAGEEIAGRQIEKTLVSVCKTEVTKLMLSRKLAPIDVELILIIEHWLEVYGIQLEMKVESTKIIDDIITPIQLGTMGMTATLIFLTDVESFSSLSKAQEIQLIVTIFFVFTILRIYYRIKINNSREKLEFVTKLQSTINGNSQDLKKGESDV